MVEQLAAAGLMTSDAVAEKLGVTLPRLLTTVSLGLVHPRPKRIGRAFLWAPEDVERARHALAEVARKRAEGRQA